METHLPLSAGLAIDTLALDLRSAMARAREAGFSGIAAANNQPELAHPDFGRTARRHLRHLLQRQNLRMAGLRAVSARGGLFDHKMLDRIMSSAIAAIRMAHDLGAATVSLYVGSPPVAVGPATPIAGSVLAAVESLANEADKAGVKLCLSSGSADFLLRLLTSVGAGHLWANLDSARLAIDGPGLLQAADRLGPWLGMWTLADGIAAGKVFRPVELGRGDLPLTEILMRVDGLNWHGEIIVDVRDLPDPQHAAKLAAEALRFAQPRRNLPRPAPK